MSMKIGDGVTRQLWKWQPLDTRFCCAEPPVLAGWVHSCALCTLGGLCILSTGWMDHGLHPSTCPQPWHQHQAEHLALTQTPIPGPAHPLWVHTGRASPAMWPLLKGQQLYHWINVPLPGALHWSCIAVSAAGLLQLQLSPECTVTHWHFGEGGATALHWCWRGTMGLEIAKHL